MQTDVNKIRKIRQLIDWTRLSDDETAEALETALNTYRNHPTAAACVWPRFASQVKRHNLRTAVVINFPNGNSLPDAVEKEAEACFGVDEVDMVINWRRFLSDDFESAATAAESLVSRVRNCLPPSVVLKVIIESGMLKEHRLIAGATAAAVSGGADFVKTSTGKADISATLKDSATILKTLKNLAGHKVGFKAAGGIKTVDQAFAYYDLVASILGDDYASDSNKFRIGASSLLQEIDSALASFCA